MDVPENNCERVKLIEATNVHGINGRKESEERVKSVSELEGANFIS
jgi:hypothetical protein